MCHHRSVDITTVLAQEGTGYVELGITLEFSLDFLQSFLRQEEIILNQLI